MIRDFFRALDAQIDRRRDAYEDPLLRFDGGFDDVRHAGRLFLAGDRNVNIADLKLEEARQ